MGTPGGVGTEDLKYYFQQKSCQADLKIDSRAGNGAEFCRCHYSHRPITSVFYWRLRNGVGRSDLIKKFCLYWSLKHVKSVLENIMLSARRLSQMIIASRGIHWQMRDAGGRLVGGVGAVLTEGAGLLEWRKSASGDSCTYLDILESIECTLGELYGM